MCVTSPARVLAVDGETALVDLDGMTRRASLVLVPEAAAGDWVLVARGSSSRSSTRRRSTRCMQLLDGAEAAPGRREVMNGPGVPGHAARRPARARDGRDQRAVGLSQRVRREARLGRRRVHDRQERGCRHGPRDDRAPARRAARGHVARRRGRGSACSRSPSSAAACRSCCSSAASRSRRHRPPRSSTRRCSSGSRSWPCRCSRAAGAAPGRRAGRAPRGAGADRAADRRRAGVRARR